MSKLIVRGAPLALVLLSALVVACSDQGSPITQPSASALAGLSLVSRNDSTPGSSAALTGPGYFRGTVFAPATVHTGNDSLASSLRISGVTVTIYSNVSTTGGSTIGAKQGSVVTDAAGYFMLPTLPAGQYIVTFVPPAGSIYQGSYAFGPLNSDSANWPWYVTLSKK